MGSFLGLEILFLELYRVVLVFEACNVKVLTSYGNFLHSILSLQKTIPDFSDYLARSAEGEHPEDESGFFWRRRGSSVRAVKDTPLRGPI